MCEGLGEAEGKDTYTFSARVFPFNPTAAAAREKHRIPDQKFAWHVLPSPMLHLREALQPPALLCATDPVPTPTHAVPLLVSFAPGGHG